MMRTHKVNRTSLDTKMQKYGYLAEWNGYYNIALDYSRIEDIIRKIDDELMRHSEVSNIYYPYHNTLKTEHSDAFTELCYFVRLVDYIDEQVDNPFFYEHEQVMDALSQIKSENYEVRDIYGLTTEGQSGVASVGFGDVFAIDGIDEQMRAQYDALKLAYVEAGEVYEGSFEDFVEMFAESGEFDFVFQEQKDREANWGWLSFVLDCVPIVGSIKNGIEIFTGTDLITGREISDLEKGIMAVGILLDCIPGVGTVGSIVADVSKQGAKIGIRAAIKSVAKNLPTYLAKEFIINIAGGLGGRAGGYVAELVGLPPWMGSLVGAFLAGGAAGKRLYGGTAVKQTLDDGSLQITRPNGTVEIRRPNGDTFVMKPNGDMRIQCGDVSTTIPHGQTGIFSGIDDIPTKQLIAIELFENHSKGRISLTQGADEEVLAIVAKLREEAKLYNRSGVPQGNFGYATTDVPGIRSEYQASSRIDGDTARNGARGFSPIPSSPAFDVFDAPNTAGYPIPRASDTEYKILSDIANQLGDNTGARGTIALFTERIPCDSCKAVIWQFSQRYPNIKIDITYK